MEKPALPNSSQALWVSLFVKHSLDSPKVSVTIILYKLKHQDLLCINLERWVWKVSTQEELLAQQLGNLSLTTNNWKLKSQDQEIMNCQLNSDTINLRVSFSVEIK